MAARKGARRRTPGTGSVWEYRTKAGEVRYAIGYTAEQPDGSKRSVTRRTGPHGEKWTTRKAALEALEDLRSAMRKGDHVDPSKQLLGVYLEQWLDGLRKGESTVASYRKNIRLHVTPYIGGVPLASVTPARLSTLYRQLERGGRADHREGEGLSARTVRYIHTILSAAFSQALTDGLLARNPAKTASPPTAAQAKAPEMHPWSTAQLAAFLRWSEGSSQHHALWYVLAFTGMRRGEALALRWRDVDLDAGTVSVRRSAGVIRNKGEGARSPKATPRPARAAWSTSTTPRSPCSASTARRAAASTSTTSAMTPCCSATTKAATCTRSASPVHSRRTCSAALRPSARARRRRSGCTTCGTRTPPPC
jgi:Phage integrase, N-terminal SAM-like domain